MRVFQNYSIQKKLLLITLVTSTVALILASTALAIYDQVMFRRTMVNELAITARMIGDNSSVPMLFGRQDTAEEVMSALRQRPSIVAACILEPNGAIFSHYTRNEASPRPDCPKWALGDENHRFERDHLLLKHEVEYNEQHLGTLLLRADLSALGDRLARFVGVVVLILGLSLAVVFFLSSWLQKIISTPILQLAHVTERISQEGEFSFRVQKPGNDEIGTLYDGFNDMLDQLEARKAEQEKLIAKLESQNAELERFTYTVSHDLKSPLVTIVGFLSHLKHDAESGQLDRMNHDIKQITSAVKTMQRLLQELLSLSQVGRLINPPEVFNYQDFVQEAINSVSGQIEARGVRIELTSEVTSLYGDRVRLLEVLQNLIDNAVKFMDNQTDPVIKIGAYQKEEMVVCYVQDNGVGIDPRYHNRIFELFHRLNATGEGTGIGLALIKRIVEVHKGRIWVESQGTGHGSAFYFTLPTQHTLVS